MSRLLDTVNRIQAFQEIQVTAGTKLQVIKNLSETSD